MFSYRHKVAINDSLKILFHFINVIGSSGELELWMYIYGFAQIINIAWGFKNVLYILYYLYELHFVVVFSIT